MRKSKMSFNFMSIMSRDRKLSILIGIFILLIIIMSFLNPSRFTTLANFKSMAIQMSDLSIMSLAMFIVILSGNIDLSIVSISNLAGMFCALIVSGDVLSNVFASEPIRIIVGILLGLIIGALCGALNGFFVGKFNLAPILVTVATSQLFYGISILIKKGQSVTGAPDSFVAFGANSLFNLIPFVFILSFLCYVLIGIFLNKTSLGEEVKLHGSNRIANLYSGCNNVRTVMITYITSGVLSAVAGIIVYSKMGVARADYGSSFISMTLLVALLSGASMAGGFGKVGSLFIASLSVQVISSGLTLGGFSPYFRQVSWGVLLLIVIVVNTQVFSKWISPIKSIFRGKNSLKQEV